MSPESLRAGLWGTGIDHPTFVFTIEVRWMWAVWEDFLDPSAQENWPRFGERTTLVLDLQYIFPKALLKGPLILLVGALRGGGSQSQNLYIISSPSPMSEGSGGHVRIGLWKGVRCPARVERHRPSTWVPPATTGGVPVSTFLRDSPRRGRDIALK